MTIKQQEMPIKEDLTANIEYICGTEETDQTDKPLQRFIFVNFSAWQYTGCEKLWAGIVTNLSTAIEEEFGIITTRLFRMMTVHEICDPSSSDANSKSKESSNQIVSENESGHESKENIMNDSKMNLLNPLPKNAAKQNSCCIMHFLKYPKTTCKFPNLYWCIIFFTFLIAVPVIIHKSIFVSGLDVHVVASWISVGIASAIGFVASLKFIWAMFYSQRRRIIEAIKGTKNNVSEELGFMNKVKIEVEYFTKLIKCAEFAHNKQYKVVISIDDLDRVASAKVKSVLEAVNILLSDPSSPFVCIIAVDPHVAAACIDENMSYTCLESGVSGYEYLKKIVNLPFCIPEITDNQIKQFLHGVIEIVDETEQIDKPSHKTSPSIDQGGDELDGQTEQTNNQQQTVVDGKIATPAGKLLTSSVSEGKSNSQPDSDSSKTSTPSSLTFNCRDYITRTDMLYRYLPNNPRNIKRISNVLSLTCHIIRSYKKRKDNQLPKDLSVKKPNEIFEEVVVWTILTDQWPYRMSYLLQVIEDADLLSNEKRNVKHIKDDTSLLDIYDKHVEEELKVLQIHDDVKIRVNQMSSLDAKPDLLRHFLSELNEDTKKKWNKHKANFLKRITYHLHHSLRQTIRHQRKFIK